MVQVTNPRVGADLVAWLRKNFAPRVFAATDDLVTIHRHSAQVELAQRLIRMGERSDSYEGSITVETD